MERVLAGKLFWSVKGTFPYMHHRPFLFEICAPGPTHQAYSFVYRCFTHFLPPCTKHICQVNRAHKCTVLYFWMNFSLSSLLLCTLAAWISWLFSTLASCTLLVEQPWRCTVHLPPSTQQSTQFYSTFLQVHTFFYGLSPPQLKCACEDPIRTFASHTARKPNRRFLKCAKKVSSDISKYHCKVWIWEDILFQYVDDMVAYWINGARQSGEEIISTLKYELEEKRNQVHRLQDDIEKCHVLIEDNAAKLKDNEQNRVELQEQTDRCQSSVRFWKYLFWLILLGLVASNYIAPKMIWLFYVISLWHLVKQVGFHYCIQEVFCNKLLICTVTYFSTNRCN